MLDRLRAVLASRYPRLVLRVALALVSFAVAVVLSVMPGPAFVFWILGFVLLGFSVGQVLLSLDAVQAKLHRHVPYADRVPRLGKLQMRRILRNRWVRTIDRLFTMRDARARRRAERRRRRAERLRRAQTASGVEEG